MLDDAHRVVVALGGQRSGKTHCGIIKLLRHIMDYPGGRAWLVAPDETRLYEGLIDKFRELCPPELLIETRLGKKEFYLANDFRVGWRSTDVLAGLRAGEKSFAVFDEAGWAPYRQAARALSDLRARLSLKERNFECSNDWIPEMPWIDVLQPGRHSSLIRVTYRRQLAITTTPKRGSFLNELLESPGNDVRVYQFHTEDNEANLPEGYIEDLHRAYPNPAEYAQEALGELVGADFPDYPDFDQRKHVLGGPGEYRLVVGGLDWGYRHELAIVIVGFTAAGVAFGIEEWGGSHISLERVALRASELMAKHNVRVFFCDQARPELIRYLNSNSVPAVKQAVILKEYRAGALSSRFQRTELGTYRLYLDPSMHQTIRQLRTAGEEIEDPAKLREIKSGKPRNDYLDALEYAVTGGERMLGSPFIPVMGRGSHREGSIRPPLAAPFQFRG